MSLDLLHAYLLGYFISPLGYITTPKQLIIKTTVSHITMGWVVFASFPWIREYWWFAIVVVIITLFISTQTDNKCEERSTPTKQQIQR